MPVISPAVSAPSAIKKKGVIYSLNIFTQINLNRSYF